MSSVFVPPPADALIEIGVIVAGPLDAVDARAAKLAVEQADARLSELFPGFDFDFFEIKRPEMMGTGRVEPSLLLRQALEERDSKHWDFAFVLTSAELIGNYMPYCFAALSRPLDAAVISMSLIDPLALGGEANPPERIERIARRLSRLILHGIGHLSGLPRSTHPNDLLFHPPDARALDLMAAMDPVDQEKQRQALVQIADQRLEEGGGKRMTSWTFFLRAAWINRHEIVRAINAARPWQFPTRLSRLTIAAFSTLAVLFMTAEAWDLALSQGAVRVLGLVLTVWAVTTFYVIARQQLMVRRSGSRRSEQSVVTRVETVGIVFFGMLTTWLTLLVVGLLLSHILFPSELIRHWAPSTLGDLRPVSWTDRPQMALFGASLGLLIGSLGASFESQHYFRHIIFVDEEI